MDVGWWARAPSALSENERGSVVSVSRFDRYWEQAEGDTPLPYLDGIDYVVMPDAFTMDVAFRTGRLDGGARGQGHYLTAERKDGYVRDLGSDVFFAEMEGGNFRLAFNVLKPGPWQDPMVRRAIALWIDQATGHSVRPGRLWLDVPRPGAAQHPHSKALHQLAQVRIGPLEEKRAEAQRLMAQAGYAEGFSMGHLCRALNTATCEFLKAQLAGLGIDLRLQLIEEGEWNRARLSLDYDSQQGRLTPSPIPEGTESVYGRYSRNPDAYAKHEDEEVDKLYRLPAGVAYLRAARGGLAGR